jgi:hypothetical protein
VSRAASLLCGTLVLFAGSRSSFGEQPAGPPAGRQVELVVGATAAEMQLLEPPIRDMLAAKRLDVTTTRKSVVTAQDVAAAIAPPSGATPIIARVLLDFTVSGQATLFLIDPRRDRVYVRRMALAHGIDAVARAGVQFVIEQSIDAILEGRDIGVSREEFQRSVAPPAPVIEAPAPQPSPAPAPVRTQLQLAGGYEGVAMGSSEIQHAARVVVAARFARLRIAGTARLAAPVSIAGDGVQAKLSTAGVGASAAGKVFGQGNLSINAGLGVGFDLTRVEPTVTTPDLQAASSSWARAPSLQAFAEVEWLADRISIAVAAIGEVHPLDERYTVRADTGTRDVYVPSRIRPAAAVLVGFVF